MAIGSRRAGAQNYEVLRRARAELLKAKRLMKTVATEAQRLHARHMVARAWEAVQIAESSVW
jgi:hypothetical protein